MAFLACLHMCGLRPAIRFLPVTGIHWEIPETHTIIPQSKLDQKPVKRLINLGKKRDCLVQRPSCGSNTGILREGGGQMRSERASDA